MTKAQIIFLIIIIVLFIIEGIFSPRLDYTRDKKLLLWYGKKTRKYIEIVKF